MTQNNAHGISTTEAFWTWARIAALSFGGPAGQIALMHHVLVEEKKWIGDARFLHALNYCMLLPGPEAQQLATYIGWLLHRTRGGLIAGLLFILPGFIAIMGLSAIYAAFGETSSVRALFFGLKAAVLAIVLQALMRVAKRALRNRTMRVIALAAFISLFLLDLPFPLVIAVAGCIGAFGARQKWPAFLTSVGHAASADGLADHESALGEAIPSHARPTAAWALRTGALFLLLWLLPVAGLLLTLGPADTFTRIALFFSQMAVVTFGGAYAVLAYVAQAAVDTYGWLRPGEMIDGLGMAETTPGPLIMVLQYVGFLAGYRDPHGLPPLLAGSLAATLTVWVTFVPCFLWIFLGAPYIEALRSNRALSGALAAITAAVVGVIANLATWFGLHTIFRTVHTADLGFATLDLPVLSSLDPAALVLAVLASMALLRFKLGVVPVLIACAVAGMVERFVL